MKGDGKWCIPKYGRGDFLRSGGSPAHGKQRCELCGRLAGHVHNEGGLTVGDYCSWAHVGIRVPRRTIRCQICGKPVRNPILFNRKIVGAYCAWVHRLDFANQR